MPFKGWMLLAIMSLTFLVSLEAETAQVQLKNGARVEAPLLYQSSQRVLLDLGFQVLDVPRENVASPIRLPEADLATSGSTALDAGSLFQEKSEGEQGFTGRFEQIRSSVCIVSSPRGYGAGFLVQAEKALVLTNYHVVRGEKHLTISLFLEDGKGNYRKEEYDQVSLEAFSALLDCALLKITFPDEKPPLRALPLAQPSDVQAGARVFAVGNPGVGSKMLEQSVSEGIISAPGRNFNDILYIQTTAAVNPGNSGGPLLNSGGEVLGLVTFRAVFQEGLAFALPVWYLRHFLEHAESFRPNPKSEGFGYRYHHPELDPDGKD